MSAIQIDTPRWAVPLLGPARYKGVHGGRGSGKSQFAAGLISEDSLAAPGEMGEGLKTVCIREVQKTLEHSAKSLIEGVLIKHGLGERDGFKVYNEVIKTPGDGLIIFQGMQDHTADSIKSLEGFHRSWVEEAQSLSKTSLDLLRPTIRWEDKQRGLTSQLLFTWNPRRKSDAVEFLRAADSPTDAVVVQANWRDNPWFPDVLEVERRDTLRLDPDGYDHIWEGGFATVTSGAYFARHLTEAKLQGRIGHVAADPLMEVRAYFDIGGTGARADATAIWLVQFCGQQIRVLDYYEASGQPLATHAAWLRERGIKVVVLPHDGETHDKVFAVSYESALTEAGFRVIVVPNQGRGAAKARIEAVRRLFPQIWFSAATTEAGRDALGWYHERKDEKRSIGLGPEHDWSSHACLAAGSLIKTARGLIPIETVEIGEKVWTPAGWGTVSNAGVVKVAHELLRLTLCDGSTITLTPDHKVFTTGGVVRADTLGYDDAIITAESAPCLSSDLVSSVGYRDAFSESFEVSGIGTGQSAGCMSAKLAASSECFTVRRLGMARERLSRSMGIGRISRRRIGAVAKKALIETSHQRTNGKSSEVSDTIAGRTATSRSGIRLQSLCTAPFGRNAMAQSLTATTSITSMVISPTIIWKTSNFYPRKTTRDCTEKLTLGSAAGLIVNSLRQCAKKQRHGILRLMAERGILQTGSGHGRRASLSPSNVSAAGLNTRHLIPAGQSSVRRVVSRERIVEPQKVYDLTVDKHHCYVANGVLVSNCDAFGLMAVAHAQHGPAVDVSRFEITNSGHWMS